MNDAITVGIPLRSFASLLTDDQLKRLIVIANHEFQKRRLFLSNSASLSLLEEIYPELYEKVKDNEWITMPEEPHPSRQEIARRMAENPNVHPYDSLAITTRPDGTSFYTHTVPHVVREERDLYKEEVFADN